MATSAPVNWLCSGRRWPIRITTWISSPRLRAKAWAGWFGPAIRKNYYAMKFKVVEPGLRPIIAMVHYTVLGGKQGRRVEIPLSVMVHNNEPYHVAVEVKGNRMVTSIEGQEIDSFTDNTLTSGGVGFFADAGEKARLYWMRVTANNDFVGRVCAYVAAALGQESPAAARLQTRRSPAWASRGREPPGRSLSAPRSASGRRKE